MRVVLRLGRRFAKQAGFSERAVTLPPGATAADALAAYAREAPALECLDAGSATVDLAVAHLSVNGAPIDARTPAATPLRDGDEVFLAGVISGG